MVTQGLGHWYTCARLYRRVASYVHQPSAPSATWLKDPGHCLALGFGSGLAPRAPGTFGSLLGIPLYFAIAGFPLPLQLALLAGLFALGVPICARTAKALGVHDHPAIVWDEVVAMALTLLASDGSPAGIAAGFALFRLFDIWKPWPIRWFDRNVHGGFGVMLDDLVAAVLAGGLLALLQHFA